ncbi:hypothetical protein TRIUR3_04126 [Triticum urartu]|uniref:Uncharacterized protein n=1 Tax=Triticum urartu TaxID=4572 RepID=M7Z108_TRIUA|nr:hypothetical protein TRIUR3_04126 [Triticum urartu]
MTVFETFEKKRIERKINLTQILLLDLAPGDAKAAMHAISHTCKLGNQLRIDGILVW